MDLKEPLSRIEAIALRLTAYGEAMQTLGLERASEEIYDLVYALREEVSNIKTEGSTESTKAYNEALANAGGFLTKLVERTP